MAFDHNMTPTNCYSDHAQREYSLKGPPPASILDHWLTNPVILTKALIFSEEIRADFFKFLLCDFYGLRCGMCRNGFKTCWSAIPI